MKVDLQLLEVSITSMMRQPIDQIEDELYNLLAKGLIQLLIILLIYCGEIP